MGRVELTVADLERQTDFYQEVVGLRLHWKEGDRAGLGAGGEDLLRLRAVPGARPSLGSTGMYHFALLMPNRRELARAVARLYAKGHPHAPTDHVMTKATYLQDPEGNHIEIYADTPEDGVFGFRGGELYARWADGRISDGREPLDVEALLQELSEDDRLDEPMPPETVIGHVHLYVASLQETLDFYHGVLGFADMGVGTRFRMGMVSAGGYHHHIGYNTWRGEGAPPAPPDALGVRYFTVVLPDRQSFESLLERLEKAGSPASDTEDGHIIRDPSHIQVALQMDRP